MLDLSLGLTLDQMKARAGSFGASETRIVANDDDDAIYQLWQLKRGEIDPAEFDEACRQNFAMQVGHALEPLNIAFFQHWMDVEITRGGETIAGQGDLEGYHVTLDGFIDALPPSNGMNDSAFKLEWTCPKPSAPVPAIFEAKARDPRAFKDLEQVEKFLPQLHQGMAIAGVEYAVLSTVAGMSVIAYVVKFDPFYWAECLTRAEAFRAAVRDGTQPIKFEQLAPTIKQTPSTLRTVDMMKTTKANLWNAFAISVYENAPTDVEQDRAKAYEKAKTQLKKLIDKDVGTATGAGITVKRDKAGRMHFTLDPDKLAEARADAAKRQPPEAADASF